MNEIDRLADWIWNVDSHHKESTDHVFKKTQEKPKGIAQYDPWVNNNILAGIEGKGPWVVEEIIDRRLSLLREWVLLLRYRSVRGQVIIVEWIMDRNGRRRSVTHDIRNFEAFCRYKDKKHGDNTLYQILY